MDIIDQLPLTAAGKVFKPALAKQQIKVFFEKELLALATVKEALVTVVRHPKKGVMAQVKVTADTKMSQADLINLTKGALGTYTVKYELV